MKIIHEREKCIGCGACVALCPKHWEMSEDGKATLLGSTVDPKTKNYLLEVKKIDCHEEAAESCPVQIIQIIK